MWSFKTMALIRTPPPPLTVCEAAPACAVADNVAAAYRRADLFERRTALMAAWAEQCARLPAQALPFRPEHRRPAPRTDNHEADPLRSI